MAVQIKFVFPFATVCTNFYYKRDGRCRKVKAWVFNLYGALLGSKLIMQTFLYNYFRIATLVARLIDNEVSFDIFSENLLLSARFMACKCFSLPLLSNCNSYHVVNCQLSFSSHFLRKLTSFLHVS